MNDTRSERDRLHSAQASIDRGRSEPPDGAAAVLGVIAGGGGTPSVYYSCTTADLDGPEVEGQAATVVPGSATFLAWNAGTAVPTIGAAVVCHAIAGRWVFRFDG